MRTMTLKAAKGIICSVLAITLLSTTPVVSAVYADAIPDIAGCVAVQYD